MNIKRSNYSIVLDGLLKLCRIECFALYLMDESKSFWIPNSYLFDSVIAMKQNKINGNIITQSLLGGLLNLSFESHDITPMFMSLPSGDLKNDTLYILSCNICIITLYSSNIALICCAFNDTNSWNIISCNSI